MTIHIEKKQKKYAALAQDKPSVVGSFGEKFWDFHIPFTERRAVLTLGDLLTIALTIYLPTILWTQSASANDALTAQIRGHAVWFVLLLGVWMTLAWLNDLYDVGPSLDKRGSAIRLSGVAIETAVVYAVAQFVVPNPLPWRLGLPFLAALWLALTLWRFLYASMLVQSHFQRRVLIVGTGKTARTIARAIRERDPGIEIVGFVASKGVKRYHEIDGLPVLDKNAPGLIPFVQEKGVSEIIMARRGSLQSRQLQVLLQCFEKGVRILSMPEIYEEITGRVPIEHINERWLVFLPINWDSRTLYLPLKRLIDIVIAGIGLLALSPFVAFIALAIKLDSPGPIFYRPERLGRQGKPFRLWKFRTMVSEADRLGDPTFTTKNDRRITRVGRLLRTIHVDELPQFINILLGQMSIIGPRPERYVPELETEIPYYRTRLAVKPGATGLALIKQGYAEGVEGTLIKLQYDLYYIKHQSLVLDIQILWKTVVHMLTMRGR